MEEYPSQLFISCEGRSSLDELLLDLAEQVRLPLEKRKEYLQAQVLEALKGLSAIICLDNLETIWEPTNLWAITEEFLNCLMAIHSLGLIITIRGNERPNGVTWLHPLLKPLSPLKIEHSLQTFEEIVGIAPDSNTQQLLREIDGISLAITLISYLIRDETESSEALWHRWQQEKTKVIQTGHDRKSSITISINLSFHSPRMTDDARDLLQLLSFLPDGFSNANEMLEDINRYIPQFREALTVLKRMALVQIDRQLNMERIHVLSPIKHYTLDSNRVLNIQGSATGFFVHLLTKYYDRTCPQAHQVISEEFYNILHLLTASYDKGCPEPDIIQTTIEWTKWSLYLGRPSEQLITQAIDSAYTTDLMGDCYYTLGQIYMYKHKLHDAEIAFQNALDFHKQAQSILGQANDLKDIGQLYMRRKQLEEAEKKFMDTLELHKQAQHLPGQANDLQNLGELYLHMDQLGKLRNTFWMHWNFTGSLRIYQLEEAEKSFSDALNLHKQAQDKLGQAYDLRNLGELQVWRDQLEEAEKSFQDALELHRQAQDVLGQRYDLMNLGEVYMHRSQLAKAQKCFLDALQFHKHAQDTLGQAYDLKNLGELYMRKDELEKAEKSFLDALEFHKQRPAEEAEKNLHDAFEFHKQAQSILKQANDLHNIGELYMRRDQLEEAEKSLLNAFKFHKQAQDIPGQANDLNSLGQLYMHRDQIVEAKKDLKATLESEFG
ncbi:hypothetical protein M422DRAFT_246986 [Sphaerobolus stellatus SS14]|nr:hypothetical protein M422DRAFT_246986 [Sphaerobolus stellatus SS14]